MSVYAAVTGHRPDKLASSRLLAYSDEQLEALVGVFERIIDVHGVTHGMSGMALGADQAWARALTRKGIPWIAAIPFEGQHRRWPYRSRVRYEQILGDATAVAVVTKDLNPAHADKGAIVRAMHRRNEFMLKWVEARHPDSLLVALWNGDTRGGTAHCVGAAQERDIRVENHWQDWLEAA